jgi:CheY-like chemotaxis protein
VKLVALTGYGQAEDRERARAAGFDVHLTKPADVATLAAVVAQGAGPRGHEPGRAATGAGPAAP